MSQDAATEPGYHTPTRPCPMTKERLCLNVSLWDGEKLFPHHLQQTSLHISEPGHCHVSTPVTVKGDRTAVTRPWGWDWTSGDQCSVGREEGEGGFDEQPTASAAPSCPLASKVRRSTERSGQRSHVSTLLPVYFRAQEVTVLGEETRCRLLWKDP